MVVLKYMQISYLKKIFRKDHLWIHLNLRKN